MLQKPSALPVDFNSIPLDLKMIPRFCLWKYTLVGDGEDKHWSKLPVQLTGRSASSTNPATWTDFLTAQRAYENGNFDGIGFVFTGDDNLVGVDIDDCRDPVDGSLSEFAQGIVDNVKGYCEVSPSGTGVKIFTRADLQNAHVDHAIGLEVYPKSRYFTVTGHKIAGDVPSEPQDLTAHVPPRTINRAGGDDFANYTPPVDGWDLARVEAELLGELDPMCGYSDWMSVGMALHHQFGGDVEALEAWDSWSCDSGENVKYSATGQNSCRTKWKTFKGGGTTLRSLIFKVNQKKLQTALANGEVVLDQSNPLEHARKFLQSIYAVEGGFKVVHYAQDFYIYSGTHYSFLEEATIRSQMYKFLDKCQKQDRKGNLVPFSANPANVNAALDALKSIVHLANDPNSKPPVWLDGYASSNPPAEKLISMQNGLFQMDQLVLFPHSLGFFTYNSLPFEYDPSATCPQWLSFLGDVWGTDAESINLLQEYFGYILSGDTKQQKFLNIIGPRRSGKGTINRVLTDLLGQSNVVSPQMEELCDTFGLQPWLGKQLASFTDARVTTKNSAGVVSQLLRIVGADTVTVNRKNKESWSGYLPTRIIVYSNEMLQLAENSNALTGRMLVLTMTNSFFGKEDVGLADRLTQELAGIFNWAIEGHKRRKSRVGERFVQPASSQDTLDLMTELSNPLASFMEEALEFGEEFEVNKDDLFACYKHWAIKKNYHPGTEMSFKRRFLASTQELRVTTYRRRNGEESNHVYLNVGLKPRARAYVDSISNFEKEIF
jgi:P4 family phage/plasmid primase-like protien